ncbi:class I SAM-dependent methyltransferase [Sphingomonas jatrophae]|uniref:Predicted methyltransferase n=1 Tax=Sphingomonas jatrophae TaxID=1166337 RepID=A0A1I6K482_9SPHN|nr:class I SAM-dependent methyltransferase [Sphingomonas jatrophae]SFR86032.1 Predicted methyltransferase [Sphingomonas jatrophae]
MRHPLIAALAATLITATAPAPARTADPLVTTLSDGRRAEANRTRDRYRHPMETLRFFGVKPGQTVVEFQPGGGWYSEILAPLQKGRGRYIPLVSAAGADKARTYFAGKADWFGPVEVATLDAAAGTSSLAPNSADVILTFRNVHNLLMANDAAAAGAFRAFFAALKPGGTLGVVDHRLPEEMDTAREKSSGYVKRSTILRLATAAGFKLAGESRVNANPKDTHDHPQGVWTLPPVLRLGDKDRAKYVAIGESDRLTLRFVKPR